MTSKEKYSEEIKNLIAKGFDFNQSVWVLSLCDKSYFADLARKYRYNRPKNSYFGLGGAFYLCLQKVYNRMKANQEI